MPERPDPQDNAPRWAVAAVVAAVLCCAAPALLVALGLGAVGTGLGAALGKPVVFGPATVVLVGAIALLVSRRRN